MKVILCENESMRQNLLPIVYTRPVALLRVGILTLREKWARRMDAEFSYDTVGYLAGKFGKPFDVDDDTVVIDANVCATEPLARKVAELRPGETLVQPSGRVIAKRGINSRVELVWEGELNRIEMLYDIFTANGRELEYDFKLVTAGRESSPLSSTCTVVGDRSRIFVEEGAQAECTVFNLTEGPVYLGRDSVVMEGCTLRGGVALLEHAQLNMQSKVYGATTLGPWCKAGGELNNVVMLGYSNKAHDGFLGNAVIGEWCNIGAGSNASNLKNDYTEIKLWNYGARRFLRTGLQFCGLIMGDHSKAGINSMFNTATVFGVGVNFHGSGYPRPFTASFSEGSNAGMTDLPLTRFFATASRVMERRGVELTEADREMFEAIRAIADTYK